MYDKNTKMNKETLRMQMLSGVITEGEYKAKLEENIHDLTPFHKGSHSTGRPDFNKMTADEIEDYLEKDKDNPGGLYGRSLSIVKHILDKKRKEETEKDSLNEHYVAGGIVGIGAINNPFEGRKKESYEDAFEYFLSQKYPLNEADEATAVGEKVEAAVEDKLEATVDNLSDEQKDQLRAELAKAGITADSKIEDVAGKLDESLTEVEGDTKAKIANALSDIGGGLMKSLLVPIIPVAIGSMGPGVAAGFAITAGTAGILIALAKALGAEKSMEEGKEVEEPYNY